MRRNSLYLQVLTGIALGVALGAFYPSLAEQMKPFGDGFIKLIRMMIAPIIFLTVVVGIASIGDMGKLGRMGLKALLYFEVLTTAALVIGLVVVKAIQPGAGMNVNPAALDASAIRQYTTPNKAPHTVDFLLNIIPETVVDAFAKGEILQVLLIAILFGIAIAKLDRNRSVVHALETASQACFGVVAIVMRAAPVGAFGAMAFTIGRYGIKTLLPLLKLLACVYVTSALFIFVVLGLVARVHGFSILKFVRYIQEEIFLVIGTSSSESALPRMLLKMENLGCSKSVVGLVIPSGYSFNLDGTSIYLTIAAIFVAQATNTHLTTGEELWLLLILMLTSKGSAAVTGGGFITLAATLSAIGSVPVAGITLLLGVDRFMSEMRSVTNLIGNGVAAVVVAKWEGEFDAARADRVLDNLTAEAFAVPGPPARNPERLLQEAGVGARRGPHEIRFEARHKQHLEFRSFPPHRLRQFAAADFRHHNIGQKKIHTRVSVHNLQGLRRILSRNRLKSGGLQRRSDQLPDHRLVIHNHDRRRIGNRGHIALNPGRNRESRRKILKQRCPPGH
jgi:aerobic C4-dicarboxylate transport protein